MVRKPQPNPEPTAQCRQEPSAFGDFANRHRRSASRVKCSLTALRLPRRRSRASFPAVAARNMRGRSRAQLVRPPRRPAEACRETDRFMRPMRAARQAGAAPPGATFGAARPPPTMVSRRGLGFASELLISMPIGTPIIPSAVPRLQIEMNRPPNWGSLAALRGVPLVLPQRFDLAVVPR